MPLVPEIRSKTSELNAREMLEFLIKERFVGKTVVTASLRSSSIAVLKMVSDIDPDTPVIFCRPGFFFPESQTYQNKIVKQLGLTNVSMSVGQQAELMENDCTHCERMWAEYENQPGRSFEIVHLNQVLAPYECWISAVYHMERSDIIRNRVDIEGRLIRVDPLVHWSKDEIRSFMKQNQIPFYKRAYRDGNRVKPGSSSEPEDPVTTYSF